MSRAFSPSEILSATTATTLATVDELLEVCVDPSYGSARQMPVYALGRFGKSPRVEPALLALMRDPEVGLHAMSALRRVIGAERALPYIEAVESEARGTQLGVSAARQVRSIRKKLGM